MSSNLGNHYGVSQNHCIYSETRVAAGTALPFFFFCLFFKDRIGMFPGVQ